MSKKTNTDPALTHTNQASPMELLQRALLEADPADMTTGQAVIAWSVLKMFEDVIETRKEEFRARLLQTCEKDGVPTDNGTGQRVFVEGSEVTRERRQEHNPPDADLKLLLATKAIPWDECYDEVKTYKLNPSKLEFLMDRGKVTAEEIKELCKVSWALKVKHSEPLARALEDARKRMLPAGASDSKEPKKIR